MKLGNFFITDLTTSELAQSLSNIIDDKSQTLLFFANTNFIVKCQHLVDKVGKAPTMIVNDGIGVELASKAINKKGFSQNLNATDFVPFFLKNLEQKRIVLFGSLHQDLLPTAIMIEKNFKHKIVGQFDGYEDLKRDGFINELNSLNADLLFVGMGNPLQEEWILNHYKDLNIPLITGVGALFKFLSGNQKRAPLWLRNRRLEWLYRLYTEPTRLFVRYSFDIFKFFKICFASR